MQVPPCDISGSARRTMRMKEWTEMSMAVAKPAREQSTTLRCKSSAGQ